ELADRIAIATAPWNAAGATPCPRTRSAITVPLTTGANGRRRVAASPMMAFCGRAISQAATARTAAPSGRSVPVRVGQKRQVAGALDRPRELPLVMRLRPGDAARDDLARLRDVGLEQREILVVDLLD